jgi:tetratricopeptide (TPR) repeat protein
VSILSAPLTLIFCWTLFVAGFSQDLNLGKKLMAERKFDEACVEFLKFKKNSPEFADSQYFLGQIFARKKETDKAEAYFKQAIAANGNIAEYHMALGSLLGQIAADANPLRQGILAPKIKNEFEIAARLDPKNLEARWMLIAFYLRAPKIMGGDIEKAKSTANEIMKINQAEGNRAWGTIWRSEEKNDLAEKNYQASVTLAPDSVRYYSTLARFYESIPDLDKALETYRRTLKRFPEHRQSYMQIGRLTANAGKNMDEGEKSLNEYIRLTPDKNDKSLANACYYLGLIEKNRGNTTLARKQFELALKINPEHKPTKKIIKTM